MKPLIFGLFIAFAIPTLACAQTVLDNSFPADTGVSLEELHAAVSADFLDPRSAQYKGLIVRNKVYKPAICGLVNARNSMGGYTRFVPFAYAIESGRASVADEYDDNLVGGLQTKTLEIIGCPLSALGL